MVKVFFFVLGMIVASCAVGHAEELSVSGLPQLLADKIKESKGAALLTLEGKPGAGAYLPIWTWHTKDGTPLVEFPAIGYRGVLGQRPDGFATITANLPGLSKQWFSGEWMRDHVKKSIFPPTFFGPAILFPMNASELKAMSIKDWKRHLALVASVRFQ